VRLLCKRVCFSAAADRNDKVIADGFALVRAMTKTEWSEIFIKN